MQGEKGDNGRGVTSFALNNGVLSVNYDDRTSQTIGNVKGDKGDKGDTGATGPAGNDYILTAADRQAIAQIAMDGLNGNGVAY